MRRCLVLLSVLGAGWAFSCGQGPQDSGNNAPLFGTVNLSLVGQGSLGNSYELTGAAFGIVGPVNTTVSGDPATVIQSLPIGSYSVRLEPGWTLRRTTETGPTTVSAVLASANPQRFVISGAQTTTVSWVFNVSPASTDQDDYEIVTVSNGSVGLTLGTDETGFANFGTGAGHTCGIATNGQLKCWGDNGSGALGYGDSSARTAVPQATVNVGVGRTVKRVVASLDSHSCALLDDNTIKCWGSNSYGQLGYGDGSSYRLAPLDAVVNLGSSNTAKSIAVGSSFTCVILDSNDVKCWGYNSYGQLGYGDTVSRSTPAAAAINLGTGNAAKSVDAGASHVCALLASNAVKCWGYNGYGQLGYGDTSARSTPPDAAVNLGSGRTAKFLTTGTNHTCAILDNDTLKCWGYNNYGQLGYGDTTNRTSPPDAIVNLGTGRTAKRVAAGASHTCAWLDDDTIKCWGSASAGQLGYEDTNQRSAPPALAVNLGTGRVPRRLLAAADHTCVLLTDNGIKCWGQNAGGCFGLGTASEYRGDQLNEMGDNLPEVLP